MPLDDDRLATASRLLRQRLSLRQDDLRRLGRSIHHTRLIEAGRSGSIQLDDLRRHFAALGATVRVTAWWNGAALDRLIDERHARVVEAVVRVLVALGWQVATEVTFANRGERGSIDVLAVNATSRAAFVGEAKSEWGSVSDTLMRLDIKTRLAAGIAFDRFRWRPTVVGAALVFPDDRTARRVAERYAATLDAAYPARSREVRSWLRRPAGPLRGLWFLTDARDP